MTSIRDILARNMKAYRAALGLTQARLAERVDTSAHYIGMIETRNKFPSPEMLERIAAALGVDAVALFSAETDQPRAMKTYRRAALKDLRGLFTGIIDEKLRALDAEP